MTLPRVTPRSQNQLLAILQDEGMLSVKETSPKASATLTGEGHAAEEREDQALACAMKPNLVRALIQRGALR